MNQKILAAALLLLSVALLAGRCRSNPERTMLKQIDDWNAATLRVSAQEAADYLGGKGSVALVAFPKHPDPKINDPAEEAVRTLQGKGMSVVGVYRLPEEDVRNYQGSVAGANILAAIKENPSAGAVISLVGAPRFSSGEWASLPRPRPKLLAFEVPATQQPQDMVTRGPLDLVIAVREHSPVPGKKTDRQKFDASRNVFKRP